MKNILKLNFSACPERKKRIGTRVLTCLKHAFTYVYTRLKTGFILGRVFCTRVNAFFVWNTKSFQFSCVYTRYFDGIFVHACYQAFFSVRVHHFRIFQCRVIELRMNQLIFMNLFAFLITFSFQIEESLFAIIENEMITQVFFNLFKFVFFFFDQLKHHFYFV
jgi:hypothetical protein